MGYVQSIARPISRPISRSILGYDSDAQKYFTAVETAGGSFDLSGIDGYDSDFSAGTDGWGTSGGTVNGNVDGIGDRDDCLSFVDNGLAGFHASGRTGMTIGSTMSATVDIYFPSTNAIWEGFEVRHQGATNWRNTSYHSLSAGQKDTWLTVTIPATVADGTTDQFQVIPIVSGSNSFTGNGTDVIYIRNVRIRNTAYSTYTESYVKTAHSNFYAGLKTDGLWNKLKEFYFLAGKTFGGLTVKGKGTGSITNNNFVSGDWLGAGSGAGLTGDGSSKYLDTGLAQSSVYNSSASTYITNQGLGSLIGATNSTGTNQSTVLTASGGVNWLADWPQGSGGRIITPITDGFIIVTGRSGTDRELYGNGSTLASDTDDVSGLTSSANNYHILAIQGGNYGSSTLTFAHIGTGLTDTDASNLSTRVNTLMTSLGCNVY